MNPKGGIIKVTTPRGKILHRFWLMSGWDRGDVWPEQKWDFIAKDENETKLAVQIQLLFREDSEER